ncbi:MAG: MBL fold metallo-hydrolase [Rhodobacterales bacterium]|nr:MBL fold metallo-hydrolase [Rhodobacterales bacterium]
MRVTILGCGGSAGTPSVEFGWSRCNPDNPRNRRLRPSILVEQGDTILLVDTSPDLRQQLLNTGLKRLDAVLFTHAHADHLHGIDDLRPINRAMNRTLDIYADAPTLETIRTRFAYVLEPLAPDAKYFYKPTLIPHEIADGQTVTIGDITFDVFEQDHGYMTSLGFRFGSVGFSTDVVELTDAAFDTLAGIHTWIVGTLVEQPHPTHAHLDKVLGWMDRVKPRRGVLTHLSGLFDYDDLNARTPDFVEPAYDGLVLDAP